MIKLQLQCFLPGHSLLRRTLAVTLLCRKDLDFGELQ